MGRAQADIDRLIEEGLTRYGRGDLDGALLSWEQVLELDPHHEQALGYIDYVRMNYELLVSEVSGHGEPPPFAISDDDPEYVIQGVREELAVGSAVPRYGAALDGWAIEEEGPGHSRMTVRQLTFEADPEEQELEPFHAVRRERTTGVSFESPTTEYSGAREEPEPDDAAAQEFRLEITPTPGFEAELTPGFGSPADTQTPGFGAQTTDVRPRDLGFVRPVAPPEATALGQRRGSAIAPELQMTLRTPAGPVPAPPVVPSDETTRSPDPLADQTGEDPPTIERSPSEAVAGLLASLPGRRATRPDDSPTVRDVAPPGGRTTIEGLPPVRTSSPDAPTRTDAAHDFDAPTTRKGYVPTPRPAEAAPPAAGTREPPTEPRPPSRPGPRPMPLSPDGNNPLVSAPTRDLGLRPGHAPDRDDDAPTGPGEVARVPRAPTPQGPAEAPRADLAQPFDPIDARSAQILAAVDSQTHALALTDESREERTRRRITTLFEHAGSCTKAGELDRAVTAIDLALSEDPNSALAQKLIHRNRDTIMNVFQSFLGDLQRTPVLARPLHELAAAPISPRAAFLLSRVDGLLSIDEILDVSGMPRLEAYRYLCQLFLRGILR
jgi:hypothetical protein